VSITAGFTVATLVACACYLAALAHARLARWPDAEVVPDLEPAAAPREEQRLRVTT